MNGSMLYMLAKRVGCAFLAMPLILISGAGIVVESSALGSGGCFPDESCGSLLGLAIASFMFVVSLVAVGFALFGKFKITIAVLAFVTLVMSVAIFPILILCVPVIAIAAFATIMMVRSSYLQTQISVFASAAGVLVGVIAIMADIFLLIFPGAFAAGFGIAVFIMTCIAGSGSHLKRRKVSVKGS